MKDCICQMHGLGQWLYDWQTLLGAVFALIAAYWAGKGLNRQINQSEQFRNEDLSQRHAAARAVLPIALSAIGDLAHLIADRVSRAIDVLDEPEFDAAFDHIVEDDRKPIEFERVSISNEIIDAMRSFVETLKDQCNVRHVAELMSSLQILVSRYNSFNFGHAAPVDGLYGLLIDAAKVSMLNGAIFNYGRFVDERRFGLVGSIEIENAWDQINQSAVGLVFLRQRLDRYSRTINERIVRYKDEAISPWNEAFQP